MFLTDVILMFTVFLIHDKKEAIISNIFKRNMDLVGGGGVLEIHHPE